MNDFAHPHFAEPQWLWLAVALPAMVLVLQRLAARARRRDLAALASPGLIGGLTRSHSPARRAVKHTLLALAAAGIGLALARPQWGVQELAARELGEDIVFALDCSRSMLATDVLPNRLERAKLAIRDFTRRHGGGRVGLVAFAGQAFLQCPLTFDYDAFEEALHAVDDKTIPVPGTDLGRAVDEAFRAMEKFDRRKVVMLLTDGEDLEKSGVRMAETLARSNVVVFAVGVGTTTGAEIQVKNEQGRPDLVRDPKGEPVHSRLDETTLRDIAEATRGAYHPLGALGEGMARIRLALEGRDPSAARATVQKLGVDRFHFPVAAVLAMLVAESLLGTRRWKGTA